MQGGWVMVGRLVCGRGVVWMGLEGVAAPPWIPDLRRGRRGGRMPDVGKEWQVGGNSRATHAPPWVPDRGPARRERGAEGVAGPRVHPGGCPQEAPLRVWLAGVRVWLCSGLVGVAARPWVPDRSRGRRVGRMPDVGKVRQVGGDNRVARPPRRVPTRGTPTRRGW